MLPTRNLAAPPLLLILLMALAGPPLATAQTTPLEKEPATEEEPEDQKVTDHIAVRDTTSDEAIESRLGRVMNATEWFTEIDVQVRDSVVFLSGAVTEDKSKEWAGELARNTEGVAAVINQLEVQKSLNVGEAASVVKTSVMALWRDFLAHSPLLIAGLVVLGLTSLFNNLSQAIVSRVARRSRVRPSLQDLVLQLLTIGIWMVGLLVAAVIVFPGMTPAKALTVLGLGSVAIGFAFKDIFENFFAGILILWKFPFDKGDFIECEDIKGRVEDITIRMTMIRQVDGQLAVVPNAMLIKNPVDVLTSRRTRRTTVICGVAYDTDLDKARDVIQTAVEECSTVSSDEVVEIFAQELADSSINFEVTWWTGPTPREIRESRDEVVRKVKSALDQAGIEIPFPQRTLWFPQQEAQAQGADNLSGSPS